MTGISTPAESATTGRTALYVRIAWRIVPVLFMAQLLASIDRANVSFAAQQMSQDLGLSAAAFGLGAGVFFIGYFLFEVPSNIFLQRLGARKWFVRILITWAIATIATAFVQNETQFYAARFLIGAAEAGLAPGIQLYFSRWFPGTFRARINGLFLLAIPMSSIVGGPLAGWILGSFDGAFGLSGWSWLFIVEGGLTLLLFPVLLMVLPERTSTTTWLSAQDQRDIEEDVAKDVRHAYGVTVRQMLRSPVTLQLLFVYFFLLLGTYGITFWMPTILATAGVTSEGTRGLLSAIPFIVAIIWMPIAGLLSDRFGKRKPFLMLGGVMAAGGLVLAAFTPASIPLSLTGMSLTAAGVLGTIGVFWALTAKRFAAGAAVIGFAIINSVGNLAGFVAPYGIGLATDAFGGPKYALLVIAAAELVAVIIVAVFVREFEAPVDPASSDAAADTVSGFGIPRAPAPPADVPDHRPVQL